MVNHHKAMMDVEAQMHGAMTPVERLSKITEIVNNWKIDVEEQSGKPFNRV